MDLAVNNFNKGLQTDTHPMIQGTDTLSDCLNGTLVTMNGNEIILLNDMGNRRVNNAFLPSGYLPVGIKEYGGVIYVAAYNPITNKSQIGSFPSPLRKIDDSFENLCNFDFESFVDGNNIYKDPELNDIRVLKNDAFLILLTKDTALRAGDKFVIYESSNVDGLLSILNYLTNYNNVVPESRTKAYSPKNRKYTIYAGILNSQNEFVDITKTLCRWEAIKNNGETTWVPKNYDSTYSDIYKFNDCYFIPDSFNNPNFSDTIKDVLLIRERLQIPVNTYAYKLIGPLYLKIYLNHVENFNYNIYGVYDKDTRDTILWIEGYFTYNCPDYEESNEEESGEEESNEEGSSGENSSEEESNKKELSHENYITYDEIIPVGVNWFSLFSNFVYRETDEETEEETAKDENKVEETENEEFPLYSKSVYDPKTNLYSTKVVKLYSFKASDTNFEYVIGVNVLSLVKKGDDEDIFLRGLSAKGVLDLSLLGSGKVVVNGWRFYNNINKNTTTLTFSFNAYPKYNEEFRNLRICFKKILESSDIIKSSLSIILNEDIDFGQFDYIYSDLPLYNGRLTITIDWGENLEFRKTYQVIIVYDIYTKSTEELKQSDIILEDPAEFKRWILTTELFNEFYLARAGISDFCAVMEDPAEPYLPGTPERRFLDKMIITLSLKDGIVNSSKKLNDETEGSLLKSLGLGSSEETYDLNNDGILDEEDVLDLASVIESLEGENPPEYEDIKMYDLNADESVDSDDTELLESEITGFNSGVHDIEYKVKHTYDIDIASNPYLVILNEELYPDYIKISEDAQFDNLKIKDFNIKINGIDAESDNYNTLFKSFLTTIKGPELNGQVESSFNDINVISINIQSNESNDKILGLICYYDILKGYTETLVKEIKNAFHNFNSIIKDIIPSSLTSSNSNFGWYGGAVSNFDYHRGDSDHFIDLYILLPTDWVTSLPTDDNVYEKGKTVRLDTRTTNERTIFTVTEYVDDISHYFNLYTFPGLTFIYLIVNGLNNSGHENIDAVQGRVWWRTSLESWALFPMGYGKRGEGIQAPTSTGRTRATDESDDSGSLETDNQELTNTEQNSGDSEPSQNDPNQGDTNLNDSNQDDPNLDLENLDLEDLNIKWQEYYIPDFDNVTRAGEEGTTTPHEGEGTKRLTRDESDKYSFEGFLINNLKYDYIYCMWDDYLYDENGDNHFKLYALDKNYIYYDLYSIPVSIVINYQRVNTSEEEPSENNELLGTDIEVGNLKFSYSEDLSPIEVTFNLDSSKLFLDYILNFDKDNIQNIEITRGLITDSEGNLLNRNFVYYFDEKHRLIKINNLFLITDSVHKILDKNVLVYNRYTPGVPEYRYNTAGSEDMHTLLDYNGVNIVSGVVKDYIYDYNNVSNTENKERDGVREGSHRR